MITLINFLTVARRVRAALHLWAMALGFMFGVGYALYMAVGGH